MKLTKFNTAATNFLKKLYNPSTNHTKSIITRITQMGVKALRKKQSVFFLFVANRGGGARMYPFLMINMSAYYLLRGWRAH